MLTITFSVAQVVVSYGSVSGTLCSILLLLHSWLLFTVITCLHPKLQSYHAVENPSLQQIFGTLPNLRYDVHFP
jgi:hypothetical protein